MKSREIRLRSRPAALPNLDTFEMAEVEVGAPGPGEVQVRNTWMSVDPYMRGRMWDRESYVPPFQIGRPLEGGAVGEVVASADDRFKPGDLVSSNLGWREAFNAPAGQLQAIGADGAPPQAFLGVAGMPGLTAWAGIARIIDVTAGETVFVSAAAGAVGQVAVQLAKMRGATVIGSAGGADKCAWVREIGADQVIDYKAEGDLTAALQRAAPKGIDAYFDNVGGAHLEAALAVARPFARLAECGMISGYNEPQPGPSNIIMVVGKRLKLQGFIVVDHFHEQAAFLQEVLPAIASGRLRWRETVDEGIEAAPQAFLKLFSGANTGKMLVKLS